ncbi:MAG: PQQ-binding-like beta-propeller repeat protein [Candidatus Bathyarchaeia archaeon]|jgi:hypothetical protein
MQISKNRTIAFAFAILLIVSIGASSLLLPTTTAHDPPQEIVTHAYIHAVPNPVGVDQKVSVFMWLTNYFYSSGITNNYRFHDFKLTITSPTGHVETQNFPVVVDTTSNQFTTVTPTEVGTYTLDFLYPGQTIGENDQPAGSAYVGDKFLPSNASTTITVQQDPIPAAIGSYPMPSEYWTRPIYGENTDWWSISSNWLGIGAPGYGGYSNLANGYWGSAPGEAFLAATYANGEAMFPGDAIGSQTNHVMWTKPLQSGGVAGGDNFEIKGDTFFDGSAYLIRFNNPIILDGKLYYTEPRSFSNTGFSMIGNGVGGPVDCVDLRTGELIWSRSDVPTLSMGLIFTVHTANEHGVCPPVLISTSQGGALWQGYDADTGDWLFNITNVPTVGGAGRSMGPSGEFLNYVMANAGNETNPDWRLAQWNTSKLFFARNALAPTMTGVKDGSISDPTNANCRYDWNVSIPWRNTMTTTPIVIAANYNDGILCYNGSLPSNGENMIFPTYSQSPYTYFWINLNPDKGAIGAVTWMKTQDPPLSDITVVTGGVDFENRVYLESCKESIQWIAYDLDSGNKLWGPSEPQAAFDYYGSPGAGVLAGQIAYGKLYSCAMGGILYCYDIKDGNLLWTYGNGGEGNSTNSGFNWPYGNIPTFVNAIGDGVVYTVTSEHTWTTPIYKDGLARAINATDGTELWTISSATMEFTSTSYAIADGFSTWFNSYDNSIYVVGRGPSKTTVEAPKASIDFGKSLIISGTVTDICSGTTQDEQSARFPNGVPVSSDASMKDWMGYVYQQKPLPATATGVTVSLDVIDANGNFRNIGTTITDMNGQFNYHWTPDIPGQYIVYASFAGTNGYWPSSAGTSFAVDEVAPPPTTTPVTTTSNNELYFIASTIAIIIAIAVATVVIITRKHP